jgi:hypothetical protein
MSRDISTIIGVLLNVIPTTEQGLRNILASVQSSAPYTAPEAYAVLWERLQGPLAKHCAPLTQPWHAIALSVFSDRHLDTIQRVDVVA